MGNEASEARVRAAVPDVRNMSYDEGSRAGMYGTIAGRETWMGYSWDDALTHPAVVAFESSLRAPEDEAARLLPVTARDWTEDATHENGEYLCKCWTCGESFIGHKRRVQCKLCAAKPVAPDGPNGDAFEEWFQYRGWSLSGKNALQAAWSAALSSTRPEGEAKMFYRVDVCTTGGKWGKFYSADWQITAENLMVDALQAWNTARLVKIETYETVIETRTKES